MAEVPKGDKFQYTHFAHQVNSFESAPAGLLPSDSRLRPDRYALEMGDMNKAASEKSRYLLGLVCRYDRLDGTQITFKNFEIVHSCCDLACLALLPFSSL